MERLEQLLAIDIDSEGEEDVYTFWKLLVECYNNVYSTGDEESEYNQVDINSKDNQVDDINSEDDQVNDTNSEDDDGDTSGGDEDSFVTSSGESSPYLSSEDDSFTDSDVDDIISDDHNSSNEDGSFTDPDADDITSGACDDHNSDSETALLNSEIGIHDQE